MDPDPGGTSIYPTGTQRNKKKIPEEKIQLEEQK